MKLFAPGAYLVHVEGSVLSCLMQTRVDKHCVAVS